MKNLLADGSAALGLTLPPSALDKFVIYEAFLRERNQVMNLTAVSDEIDVVHRHFLDSVALMAFEPFASKSVIDIGSGAGFPGIPLKIAEPSVRLTLLDAHAKRVHFLEELGELLALDDVHYMNARAEEAAAQPGVRETFDVAVSRAVARLNVLCELCLPFVAVGGLLMAMKSVDSDEEIHEAESAMTRLGAELERRADYAIPGTDIQRRIVLIRKTEATPDAYPRRYARIQKAPL